MTPKPGDHLTTLKQFQAWRRDTSDRQNNPMPDPKEIGKALDWAIKTLKAQQAQESCKVSKHS